MASPNYDRILSFSQKNDPVAIQALLAAGVPPTHTNGVGQSGIHISALWGNVDALLTLLDVIPKNDPFLNSQNKISGATALHCAARSNKDVEGRRECVRILVEWGADPNILDSYGDSASSYTDDEEIRRLLGGASLQLHELVRTDDIEKLEGCIKEVGEDMIKLLEAADAEGNTPLLLAVKEKNINIALYLLKELEGADLDGEDVLSLVNRSNNDDATALILASKGGMTEVCTKLLSMGANPGHQDFGDNDSLAMMGAPQKHFTPLHYAVKGKNMALCQIFLDYMRQGQGLWGCDLTVIRDENGMQPWQLLFSCGVGTSLDNDTLNILKLFSDNLEIDADNKLWGQGGTALSEACKKGNVDLAAFCLQFGADPNKPGRQGLTPLHFAARGGKVDAVKLLLESGNVVLNLTDCRGKTALDYAVAGGKDEVVELLKKDE